MNYLNYLDIEKFKDFNKFLIKVNERTEHQFNLRDYYSDDNNPVYGKDVEYFGFNILQDDRMRYIIENIVTIDGLSPTNKIGNTIISHFYGARGIHQIMTDEKNPKIAHVDFDRISSGDKDYIDNIKNNATKAKAAKKKFYGSTELHTSLQTAARNYCRLKYDDGNRPSSNTDIIEWIASWVKDGTMNNILDNATTLEKMYNILTSKPGIGEYYGYHCATSNSVNPSFVFNHDESFCRPGPGAKSSLDLLFPKLKGTKKIPYSDLVIWLRDNQDNLYEDLNIHDFFHNFHINGNKIFKEDQHNMKVYGTEVALCQYGVKCHLENNPHLINKRKVVRLETEKSNNLSIFL